MAQSRKLMMLLCIPLFLLILVPPALSQAKDTCMMCHKNASLSMTKQGRKVSLFVDAAQIKASAHGNVPCAGCHPGFNPMKRPHAEVIKPVKCQTCHAVKGYAQSVHGKPLDQTGRNSAPVASCKRCHGTHGTRSLKGAKGTGNGLNVADFCGQCHKEVAQKFQMSAHGMAYGKAGSKTPGCLECHGSSHTIGSTKSKESPLYKTNEPKFCLKCHLDDPEVQKKVGFAIPFMAGYNQSVHGIALASGNMKAAACSDCHGAHEMKLATDPSSRVSKWNVADTCARCHAKIAETYNASIHGIAVRKGISDSPTCTDCHGQHHIFSIKDSRSPVAQRNLSEQICATCHNSVQLNQKYGIAPGRFASFADSYHGLASRAGSVEVANCASCHGVHNIKPSSDPTSTVNPANLAVTCGNCHPGANANFAKGAVHVLDLRDSRSGILYWIRTIYIFLIIIVVGGMVLHNLLDFIKKTRHRLAIRQGKINAAHHSSAQYVRMTLNERIQHAMMFSSFIVLAITGFMLRYPDSWWVLPLRQLSTGFFEMRSALHRIAAVVMVAISIYHIFYMLFTKRGRRFTMDMLPRFKDIGDVFTNVLYLTGLSKKKPLFERFGYIEKAEYWALVWGVIVMAVTGFIMWFDNYFMGQLTKLGWDISRTIHFYEACLATLAILAWHFYFVLFNPDIYPMSSAWLTGKISEEEMADEHPLELEKLKKLEK
jgi:cytochrome b subunit of formate dehydrogenase